MKKHLFFLLALAFFNLNAAEYRSSIAFSPINQDNQVLVELTIEKILEDNNHPIVIAMPKLICTPGGTTMISMTGSPETEEAVIVQLSLPENWQTDETMTRIIIKEKGSEPLEIEKKFTMNQ